MAPSTVLKEAKVDATFLTFKDTAGKWRWILKSSNAFEDREGEIVTTKALEKDVARTDRTGEYGPLRWWHVGTPVWKNPLDWRSVRAGRGVDIGDCDFSAMDGPMLIESGTFKSDAIGEAIASKMQKYRASLGFSHPLDQPDHEKLFHNINRFERSLTPANRASNLRTGLVVTKERTMDPAKLAAFKEAVGDDIAAQVLQDSQSTTKEARAAGIREKAEEPILDELSSEIETLAAGMASFKEKLAALRNSPVEPVVPGAIVEKAPVVAAPVDDTEEDDLAEDGEDGGEDDVYVGDMTGPEFVGLLQEALGPMFETHNKSLDLHKKLSDVHDSMKEMKTYMGGLTHKDDGESETVKILQEQVRDMGIQLKEATGMLEELGGGIPRELAKPRTETFKASESTQNLINLPDDTGQVAHSPLSWIDSFVVNSQQQAATPVQTGVVIQPR